MPSGKKERSLKKKYSSFFINKRDIPEPEPEPENSMEGICPSLREFKDSQEDTDPVLGNKMVSEQAQHHKSRHGGLWRTSITPLIRWATVGSAISQDM